MDIAWPASSGGPEPDRAGLPPGLGGIRGTEYSAYIADDWRASSRLTFNLGLRYELDTPYNEVANRWANFDPVTATVLIAGRNGVSKSAGVETWKRGFAPRFGFAYSLFRRTVIRGGFGIFYNTSGHGGNVLRLQRHVPFGPIYSFNPGNFFVSRRVSDGFPAIPPLNLALADNPSGGVIGVLPTYKPGYAQQFNLTLEHEITPGVCCSRAVMWETSAGAWTARSISTSLFPGREPSTIAGHSSVSVHLAGITYALSDGLSSYHALQFSAEKRFTARLELSRRVYTGDTRSITCRLPLAAAPTDPSRRTIATEEPIGGIRRLISASALPSAGIIRFLLARSHPERHRPSPARSWADGR